MVADDRKINDEAQFLGLTARQLGMQRHTPEQLAADVPFRPDGSPAPTKAERKAQADAARRDNNRRHSTRLKERTQPDGSVRMTRSW